MRWSPRRSARRGSAGMRRSYWAFRAAYPVNGSMRRMSTSRLLALSDLHVAHAENRAMVETLRPASPGDWLLLAGDVGEHYPDIEWALTTLSRRFAKVVWTPG